MSTVCFLSQVPLAFQRSLIVSDKKTGFACCFFEGCSNALYRPGKCKHLGLPVGHQVDDPPRVFQKIKHFFALIPIFTESTINFMKTPHSWLNLHENYGKSMKGEVPPQPRCLEAFVFCFQEEKRSQRERERHGRRPRGERREERTERREERAERPRRRLKWGIISWGVFFVFCCWSLQNSTFYASEPSNFLVAYVTQVYIKWFWLDDLSRYQGGLEVRGTLGA